LGSPGAHCRGDVAGSAPAEDLLDKGGALDPEVLGYHLEDGGEGADAERLVGRDRDVMLAALLRRQAQVATGLPRDRVAEPLEPLGEVAAREVARQLYAAMTSSCT
jgi:hypothetical protein